MESRDENSHTGNRPSWVNSKKKDQSSWDSNPGHWSDTFATESGVQNKMLLSSKGYVLN